MTQQRVLVTRVNSYAAVRPTLEALCFYRRRNSTALKKIREYLRIHYGYELNQHNNSQISWALDILRRWGIAKHARKRGEWGLTDYGLLDPPPPTDEQIRWVRDKCFTITIIPPQQRQQQQTEPTEIEPAERLAMIPELFLDRIAALYRGDSLKVLPKLAANSMDSCVTDPPYHLVSIVKRFGSPTAKPVRVGNINATSDLKAAHARAAAGFMGKTWDGGDIAARPEVWREVYRVLKPGAHLLAFGGTRTYHRMACAIEDAGFEIRDTIMWVYGSGFPKSHDVSKGIDRAAGAKRDTSYKPNNGNAVYGASMGGGEWNAPRDPPVTAAARQWQGWGTALKPAVEPILLARKPLSEKTVATNVLKWGTGALNIGGCRIPTDEQFHVPQSDPHRRGQSAGEYCVSTRNTKRMHNAQRANIERTANLGRWPANLVHDGSAEVVARFPDLHGHGSTVHSTGAIKGMFKQGDNAKVLEQAGGESGSAARFFYTAKADQDTRLGSKHPTVKPLDLMRYLVRLVTPPKGVCLDPFAGTGTTAEAAWREGMWAVLIEAEPEYQADIATRLRTAKDYYAREVAKMRRHKVVDMGPFFTKLKDKNNAADN